MTTYEIDYTFKTEETGYLRLDADDLEQAEEFAKETVKELYDGVTEVQIDTIKEVA